MLPKVLVISNECFSKNTSNGRTLGNFFVDWPNEHLAQFFISGTPDAEFCKNYFQVSDRQALNALLHKGNKGGRIDAENMKRILPGNSNPKKTKRNALTMLLREFVWQTGRWKKLGYWRWVEEFNPAIVLLQAGDCAFMFNLACRTAKKLGAKLVIYNTEGYYFKDFDYFKGTGIAHKVFPVFLSKLKYAIRKGYRRADYAIFNCETLCQDFCKEFNIPSSVIYTATDLLDVNSDKEPNERFIVTYAGNLGVGRPQSLVDIANVLQEIGENYFLDVYGTIPNDAVRELFENCKGISFHGKVSYDEVKKVMSESDLLVHVEGFDSYYIKDLKYAFSTKIADCLASNRCFLMYAPTSFAGTQYLMDNKAAYVVSSKEKLKEALVKLIDEPELRKKYLSNAQRLAMMNHNKDTSVATFQKILCELV